MRARVVFLVVACIAAAGGVAQADADLVRDPDDTSGRLDVRYIRHGHGTEMRLLRHRISTRSEWRNRLLRRRGAGRIYLLFSTRRGDCAELRMRLARRNGELRAALQSYDPIGCGPYDDFGGQSNFQRVDAEIERRRGTDLIVTFPRRELGRGVEEYKWSVWTELKSRRCERRCTDFAPDEGGARHGVLLHDLDG
ncbi:MAG TPA: hypothetical protein VIG64_13075 [Actinomycetota bacterium]|jgi:hypothetical protein